MTDDSGGGGGGAWECVPSQLGELLDLVDEAVVICDRADGPVRGFNRAAARLFPRLRPGGPVSMSAAAPLARAAARRAEHFSAAYEGRGLTGRLHTAGGLTVWLVHQVSSAQEAEAALAHEREKSAFLEETTRRLGASLHHGRTVRALVEIVIPKLADASVVVLPVSGRRTRWHRAGPGDARCSGEVAVETLERVPKVADALYGLQPRPTVVRPQEMDALDEVMPGEFGHVEDALVVQLAAGGVPAGALIMLRGPERARFDDADIELAHRFAVRAGLALATAALYSQQAQTIAVLQASMAPEPLPSADGLRLGAAYRPAAEALRISGDFYHVAPSAAGGVTFFFGDVSGKGAEAAVVGGQVRQSMRTLAMVRTGPEPLSDLRLLNDLVMSAGHRFTTLVTGSARPCDDGSVKVEIASGGHLSPLVLRDDGKVAEIVCEGMLLGAVPDPSFGRTECRLEPGELMLLYSDGVTEARGGASGREIYGDERLVDALASCGGMQAPSVAERLELLTTEWLAGRPHDDISILTLQAPPRRGAPSHRGAPPHHRPEGPGGSGDAGEAEAP
ncbi:PP2C family protein-serine/threonine phosphatase [Streptomyces violaceusniger]|uniref:Protein serine/threonine phosphatase n=1 Tax=Streptomyces violaceusniger (strain Tu 4113) TaxID=653045 RepID=G2PBR9_STRV4|nr:PP2C family protein-serine/threonine phosphatase [Streptomyces violaceusniger]AEM80991.1 protein serine/threonine phosphatase [Streptomyces violaceusniger Tu 4113]